MRWITVVVIGACSYHGRDTGSASTDAPAISDAAVGDDDAMPADAVVLGAWGPPMKFDTLSTADNEDDPSLTGDLLEIYFGSDRATTPTGEDVWMATRTTPSSPWSAPVLVAELSSTATDSNIKVSSDGLTIWQATTRGSADADLYVSTRLSRVAPWSTPQRVDELCTIAGDYCAYERPGGLRLVFCSSRTGNEEIYVTERAQVGDAWGTPVLVDGVNSTDHDCDPMEPDDSSIYFSSLRPGLGDSDIYYAERLGAGYLTPVRLDVLNTGLRDRDPWVSADGRLMVFSSNRDGTDDLFYSVR